MIREKLEARRTAEMEIRAIERQIEKCMSEGGPSGYPPGRVLEKIPDRMIRPNKVIEDEGGNALPQYSLPGGRTNNPQGAMLQHEEGYRETLNRLFIEKQGLFAEVERIIEGLPPAEGRARTILRYYYCQAWSDRMIANELDSETNAINRTRSETIRKLEEGLHKNNDKRFDIKSNEMERDGSYH